MTLNPAQAALFFDGSCKLCRHEINWLGPKLKGKMQLVDISQPDFTGFNGASKMQMMQQIHVWDGQQFLIGLTATLFYWRLAGLRLLPAILAFPLFRPIANWAYQYWARKRLNCTDGQCEIK
ncbi:DUF393 domain-containing protein [Rheinheimera sp. UJ51]|uniref:thiol-disulfide oxidoreductase DCC family protein n=1 Tax=Rheinheimera sp. UJ51 TaxID=2892446 RepID=UPI001E527215|nr:DUF393 domain-containing protein [Rheinheimera sp. UJ51]MCC5450393.1 DUF393 domain-containing protein [Rheinheimera sp. UJ51]